MTTPRTPGSHKYHGRSPAWDYFKPITVDGVKKARCKTCNAILSVAGGSTSAIRGHLLSYHKDQYMEAERKRAQLIKEKVDMDEEHDELLGELTAPSMATKRKFGEVSAHKWKSGDPRQLNGDLAIMKFIASNNYSFNVVETVGFRELIETLCPKLQIKSASTFSRYMIFIGFINFRIFYEY